MTFPSQLNFDKRQLNQTRGLISPDFSLYVSGCGMEDHLFLSCNYFGSLLYFIRNWLGISSIEPYRLGVHIVQFGLTCRQSSTFWFLLQLLWFSCIWTIWKERNRRIFNQKEEQLQQLLDKIKLLSFWWLKTKYFNFPFDYHIRWLNPLLCRSFALCFSLC